MKNKEMEEKLQKVREKLVNEKCEKRDKASSLIEVLRKSKLITKEETEEIRKKIIDNFNKKEDTGVYEEVNKKFHGIRKIRREIAKINKEIGGEEDKLVELNGEIREMKKMDLDNLSSTEYDNMKKQYHKLLMEKKKTQEKINELNEKKQNKEREAKEEGSILGMEIKEEKRGRNISVTPIETEEVGMIDVPMINVPMKELGKKRKRGSFFLGERKIEDNRTVNEEAEIEENTAVDEGDTETYTPKMYYEQKESELRVLEEDYEEIKGKLGEDLYLDEGYKAEFLIKLTEKYNKLRKKIEEDERYKEIKEKKKALKRKLEEMEKKKVENEKEIKEVEEDIGKLRDGNMSDEDKEKEFDLVPKKKRLLLENENLVEEIRKCKEEYGEFKNEGIKSKDRPEGKINRSGTYKVKIGGKMLEVYDVDGKRQIKWGGNLLGEYEYIFMLNNPLLLEVGGKPMFWASDDKRNCKLIRGDEVYNGVKWNSYNLMEIGKNPCIKILKKDKKYVVIRGNKQIGGEYEYVSEIMDVGGKPCFNARKENGKEVVIWGDKQIGSDYYHIEPFFIVGGKPCFKAKKRNGKEVVIWGDKQVGPDYLYIKYFFIAGGKPCFVVQKESAGNYEIVRGNDKIGSQYKSIQSAQQIGRKPCFVVNNSKNVIRGNEKLGKEYKDISGLAEIQGQLYYVAENKDGTFNVIRNKEKVLDTYSSLYCLGNVDGVCVYEAGKRGSTKQVLIMGKEQFGEEYESIWRDKIIGGIPCFRAEKKQDEWVFMWGKKQIGGTYFSPTYYYRNPGGVDDYFGEVDGRPCFKYRDESGHKFEVRVTGDNGEYEIIKR